MDKIMVSKGWAVAKDTFFEPDSGQWFTTAMVMSRPRLDTKIQKYSYECKTD